MTERKLVLSVTAKDCELQTFRCGGPGGQKQNKTSSGVRWIHRASGARGECREERSQLQNKKIAWRRMVESKTFQVWLKRELGGDVLAEAELERRVQARLRADLAEENLRWEFFEPMSGDPS
jgi:protein subunit release factor B